MPVRDSQSGDLYRSLVSLDDDGCTRAGDGGEGDDGGTMTAACAG